MTEWFSIEEKLPEIKPTADGGCNFVLVRYKELFAPEASSRYQTGNTVYVNKYPSTFTHWAYITEPEELYA
jgi:hypothetical protein